VGGDVFVDSDTLVVTDFMNLKIKRAQSFRGGHKDKLRIHRGECSYIYSYMSICVSTVFLKKIVWTLKKLEGEILKRCR
jgi:hypothetical protein